MTSTELGYLSGVTSNIQTQLDGKAPTITIYTSAGGDHTDVSNNWGVFPNGFTAYSVLRDGYVYGGGGFVYKIENYGSFIYTDYESRHYICTYYNGSVYVYNMANNLVSNYGDSLPSMIPGIGNIFFLKSS